MKDKILLITHFNYSAKGLIHGPVDSITGYLRRKKIPYTVIAHPLYTGRKSFIETYQNNKIKTKTFGTSFKLPTLFKSLVETILTLKIIGKEKYQTIIAIDPLNALAAIILKRFGKCEKIIFYTVDYAEKRFPERILNFLYHLADYLAIKNSDYLWSVSRRILEKRKKQGIIPEKNLYVPNTPSFSSVKRLPPDKVDRFKVVMVIGQTHSFVLENVLTAWHNLTKKYSQAKLVLIGPQPQEKNLSEKISSLKLKNNVLVLGQLKHKDLINNLRQAGLGLAIYTKDYPWTYYGDSMKAREYLLCGLPVIITDVVSTADDIFQNAAGIVIKPEESEIQNAIKKFFANKNFWIKTRKNAIEVAKEYDLDYILDREFDNKIKIR